MKPELIWAMGIFAGVVVVAALVNRVSPMNRHQLRRLVILYVLYILVLGGAFLLDLLHVDTWAHRLHIAAQLLRGCSLVNVVAMAAFSVVTPAVRVRVPMIATDLLVGFGYIVALFVVLTDNDLNPTGALVSGAVVSAVLAISLQSTLGNILGGIALQLDGSIHEGDWIQLENGKQGKVRSVRWRHTVVETRDWSTIVVPNAQLLANNITILGKREGRAVPQRMWVWFNVDFRYSPTRVIDVVTEAMLAAPIENVADDPKPNVVCMDFTKEMRESFATYAVRYWLVDLAPDDPTNSRVRARIYGALKRAGIPIAVPFQTRFVEHREAETTKERAARHLEERLDAIRKVQLFRTLTEAELRTLAEGMSHTWYTKGEVITRQGAVAHWLYVMTGGNADIKIRVDPDGDGPAPEETRTVAKIHAPDFFGEMGLMTGEPRLADVIATTDVECFRLGKETFEKVLLPRPEMAEELSKKLAERRVELIAVRDGLDPNAQKSRTQGEAERILKSIKSFFGL
jgi:small-conductance mechanosensitive channel/CRP-like cAMP-binding protein